MSLWVSMLITVVKCMFYLRGSSDKYPDEGVCTKLDAFLVPGTEVRGELYVGPLVSEFPFFSYIPCRCYSFVGGK